ncbi:unnamed protein product [Orchesella dallaii]|uniref:Uncharacterized protein n=1 Tax=Orchesella dallaii TaxID=48710 RepID=A0ABP1QRM3_9HEXA
MGFRQVFLIAIVVGVAAVFAQPPPPPQHGLFGPQLRSPNTLQGIGKQMTDFALNKFISAVRGGGRGHRELLALTSNPYSTIRLAPPPQYSFGRVPPSITHVPPAPKLSSFYITPPERDAPFFYGGPQGPKRQQMFKLTELKYGRPLTLLSAETSNAPRPGPGGQTLQLIPYRGATQLTSAATNIPQQQQQQQQLQQQQQQQQLQQQQQQQQQQQGEGSTSNSAQSLQEIIAKAAQEQHAQVLQKEQKAHPNAQITNSQIILPGGPNGPQQLQGLSGGRQPIFVNQFGQQFLAPAIFGPGQQQPQQLPQGLPPQFLQALQGQGQGPPQHIQYIPSPHGGDGQRIQYIPANGPEFPGQLQQGPRQHQQPQFLRQGPGGPIPQQGGQLQLISPQGIPISAFQGLPPQAGGHGQLFGIQGGALTQGQLAAMLSQQGAALQGLGGQLVPGNSILGSPHYALVSGNLQGQVLASQLGRGHPHQQQQQQQQQGQKEEQPTRPQESASEIHSTTTNLEENSGSQFQAAIMQSQAEYSEPITKM